MNKVKLYSLKRNKLTQEKHLFNIKKFAYPCEFEEEKSSVCGRIEQNDTTQERIIQGLSFPAIKEVCFRNDVRICKDCLHRVMYNMDSFVNVDSLHIYGIQ